MRMQLCVNLFWKKCGWMMKGHSPVLHWPISWILMLVVYLEFCQDSDRRQVHTQCEGIKDDVLTTLWNCIWVEPQKCKERGHNVRKRNTVQLLQKCRQFTNDHQVYNNISQVHSSLLWTVTVAYVFELYSRSKKLADEKQNHCMLLSFVTSPRFE